MKVKAPETPPVENPKRIVKFQVKNRHNLHGGDTGYNVVPVSPGKATLDSLATDIAHATTIKRADIAGAVTALTQYMGKALAQGYEVELKGLGRFRLVLTTKEPISDPARVRSSDVLVKRISFEPDSELTAYFNDIHFHRDKTYAPPVGTDEQEQLLSDYFYEHDAIDSKTLASLLHCGLTTSRARLKVLVARGRLAPIPLTRTWYRPTPGNFGH
jgi:Bacterial nucleoid DNA-binding protein